MDLKSGYPYWLLKNGLPATHPSLKKDHSCEVLIIGGGISGAIAAYDIAHEGFNVTVVDGRHFGTGSTSASTALVQFETDEHLTTLIEKYGEKKAVRCYQLAYNATQKLGKIVRKHRIHCGYTVRNSLYIASNLKDKEKLVNEYETRIKAGFQLEYWEKEKIVSHFGFNKPAALWTENNAELDPLQLTNELIKILVKRGVQFFDGTVIKSITSSKKNKISNYGYWNKDQSKACCCNLWL